MEESHNLSEESPASATTTTGASNQKCRPCKSKVKFKHRIRGRRLLRLMHGRFCFASRIRILPLTTTNAACASWRCWKAACSILGLDAVMQSALLTAFLSGNEKSSICSIWWIPSILSLLFSSLTLFPLLYLLKHVYSIGKKYLFFTALVFILVSALVTGAFRLTLC